MIEDITYHFLAGVLRRELRISGLNEVRDGGINHLSSTKEEERMSGL